MAKPKDTKSTKWKLIVSSPVRYLTRENAVEWGKSYKLPYTITKRPPLRGSRYRNSWELRVYQPYLWKGRKVEGSADYGVPYRTKKQAMGSYRHGSKKWELAKIRGGAWVYLEVETPSIKALFQTHRTKPRHEITVRVGTHGGLYCIKSNRKVYLKKIGWAYNSKGKPMDVYGRKR